MSKRHRLLLRFVLCFKNCHKPVFLPVAPPFYIIQLRSLWCFGRGTRILHMLCPRIVPETVAQRPETLNT